MAFSDQYSAPNVAMGSSPSAGSGRCYVYGETVLRLFLLRLTQFTYSGNSAHTRSILASFALRLPPPCGRSPQDTEAPEQRDLYTQG